MKRIQTPHPLLPFPILLPLLLLFLAACVPLTPIPPTPTPTPTRTPVPTGIPSATPIAAVESSGLQVLVDTLAGEPTLDPLGFTTLQGEQIGARQLMKAAGGQFPDRSFFEDMRFSMWAQLGTDRLIAREDFSDIANGLVTLSSGRRKLYEIPVGLSSPITALRGLWVYDAHWVLETVYIDPQHIARGRISRDGVLLNEADGYDEAFGFQTIAGRPFYFFERNGEIDAVYDGQAIPLGYDRIPHYGCCSPAELNPYASPDGVSFFGVRGSTWYFVRIGVPGSFGP